MATKKKRVIKEKTTRKKATVKDESCRTAGHQMTSKNPLMRKAGAKKLGSRTCKNDLAIYRSTSKITKISKLAKKIRKPNETWQAALKRASKQLK